MAGGYRYSAALDKTYTEKQQQQQQQQRWAAPSTQNLPVRTVPIIRATPAPGPSDPLRFIKTSQAPLIRQAREQVQAHESKARKQQHSKLEEQEEQWQTNLDEWKSRRRKASERAFQRVQDAKQLFPDDDERREREPEPTLTTSTELLSEYSTREEFVPSHVVTRTSARPAAKGPKPPVPPKPMTEPRRKEEMMMQGGGICDAGEQDTNRQLAPAEATLSVSGRKLCSHCSQPLGHGAAMVIESLQLLYHLACFRCCVCQAPLGNGLCGTDVRVRNTKLHCTDCYSNDEAGVKLSRV